MNFGLIELTITKSIFKLIIYLIIPFYFYNKRRMNFSNLHEFSE